MVQGQTAAQSRERRGPHARGEPNNGTKICAREPPLVRPPGSHCARRATARSYEVATRYAESVGRARARASPRELGTAASAQSVSGSCLLSSGVRVEVGVESRVSRYDSVPTHSMDRLVGAESCVPVYVSDVLCTQDYRRMGGLHGSEDPMKKPGRIRGHGSARSFARTIHG